VRVIGYPGLAQGPPLEGVLQCQRDLAYSGPTLDLNMVRGIVVGFSGSPVVDARGRVLGLVNVGMPGKAFGGTAAQIEALRSGNPVPLEEWDRTPLTRFGRANLAMSTALTIEGQRFEEAMRTLREAVAESPDCWAAWGHLLANYKGAGDSDAALEAATHAAAGPTAQHSFSLAALLRARGRNDEADAAEARAASIDPGGLSYLQARDRGVKAMREGRYRDALPDLSTAVNGDPNSLELWSSVLQCMAQAGYAAQAAGDSERLLRRFPTSALAHFTRGVVMAGLDNPVAALKAFRTATDLDPAHAPTHHTLGLLYARLRDFPAAEQELAILQRLDPASARALEASIAKARSGAP
jgi:tetratricopeptide (TPR) repeat protein